MRGFRQRDQGFSIQSAICIEMCVMKFWPGSHARRAGRDRPMRVEVRRPRHDALDRPEGEHSRPVWPTKPAIPGSAQCDERGDRHVPGHFTSAGKKYAIARFGPPINGCMAAHELPLRCAVFLPRMEPLIHRDDAVGPFFAALAIWLIVEPETLKPSCEAGRLPLSLRGETAGRRSQAKRAGRRLD